jgi:hypothetical protein
MVQRRKKPCTEGLATHGDPESCGHDRKGVPEALTGAHAGRVLSREIEILPGAEVVSGAEGNTSCTKKGEVRRTWRGRHETPSMRGSTMRENRETLHTVRDGWRRGPRWEVQGLEPPMHGAGSLTAA